MRSALLVVLVGALATAGAFVYARRRQDSGALLEYNGANYDPWNDSGGEGALGGAYDMQLVDSENEGDTGSGVINSFLAVGYGLNSIIGGRRMDISISGIDAIKEHEALRLTKYRDQGGKWTIGYGHLIGPFESFPGPITEERALTLLVKDLADAESAVNALVSVPITQEQYDALVSLTFNIGAGAFRTSSVLRRLNAGDSSGAAEAFALWNKVNIGGRLMASAGLSARRASEAALFSGVSA